MADGRKSTHNNKLIIHKNRNTMKNKIYKIGPCRIYRVSERILKA